MIFEAPAAFLLQTDLVQMVRKPAPPVRVVLGILPIVFSIFSWTVIFSKLSALGGARKTNWRFLRAFRKAAALDASKGEKGAAKPGEKAPAKGAEKGAEKGAPKAAEKAPLPPRKRAPTRPPKKNRREKRNNGNAGVSPAHWTKRKQLDFGRRDACATFGEKRLKKPRIHGWASLAHEWKAYFSSRAWAIPARNTRRRAITPGIRWPENWRRAGRRIGGTNGSSMPAWRAPNATARRVLLCQPRTFMNASGEAVKAVMIFISCR